MTAEKVLPSLCEERDSGWIELTVTAESEVIGDPNILTRDAICRVRSSIYLNHDFGPGWICRRCGVKLDVKTLRTSEP